MKIKMTIFALIWVVVKPINAVGQHNPDAHTHGEGHMTLVFDNGHLLVERKTPAVNMLGFEHKPNSVEQWQVQENLKLKLRQPKGLIVLEPECQMKESAVDLPFKQTTHKKTHEPGSKINHEHHDNHADHHIDRGKNVSLHAGHSDIYCRYEWQCKGSYFPKLTLEYFTHYPAFEAIIVEWVVNGSQGVTQLDKREISLEIAK